MNPITLPVSELKPALIGLGKIISRRSTLPVLGHILIKRNLDGWVTLAATDLDSSATVRLEQPGEGTPTSLLIPFAELQKTAKNCKPGEDITVTGSDKELTLRYPIGAQFAEQRLDTLPVEEFPPLPQISGTPVKLEPLVRASLLDAMECASTDETRPILGGAYLDVSQPGAHYVVATDGRHLYSSNSFSLPLKESVLIPDHRFLGWKGFGNDGEWQLQVEATKGGPTLLQISSRRWTFATRQTEGNYPNWRQVVPDSKQFNTTVSLPQGSVDSVLGLIPRIPCHDQVNQTIGLKTEGGKLFLRGRGNGDLKWTDLEISGAEVRGDSVSIYCNRSFIAKALTFGLNQIEIIDPLTPMRFSNAGRQMIVMPIRADGPPAHSQPAAEPTTPKGEEAKPDPAGDQTERTPMSEDSTTGADSAPRPEKPALEQAQAQVDIVKTGYREAIAGLGKLTDLLRQATREQKAGDKEIQSVRHTLRSLQGVRI